MSVALILGRSDPLDCEMRTREESIDEFKLLLTISLRTVFKSSLNMLVYCMECCLPSRFHLANLAVCYLSVITHIWGGMDTYLSGMCIIQGNNSTRCAPGAAAADM
jgi:hypothetical protein